MKVLTWNVPVRWAWQRWLARQPRLVRFIVAFVAFSAILLTLAALVPDWGPVRVPALIGGALAFAAITTWLPRRDA